jgi:peptidoglycan/xylan/chitin deacetylase (PgdA/CDA1 family)
MNEHDYHDRTSLPDWTEGLLGLMYHAVESPPLFHSYRGLYVEPSLLEHQLRELVTDGVTFISLTDWIERGPSPGRQAFITFDDGFLDLRENALPVLNRLGLSAITYVVAENIGGTNAWDANIGAQVRPLMSRADLLAWQEAGQEIGSHTLTHARLTQVPLAQARAEIFDSRKKLEDLAGRPVRHFCYPYGDLNPAIRDLVGEAGYVTATTTKPGFNGPGTDPLLMHRFAALHRKPYRAALRGALLRCAGLGSPRPPAVYAS